MINYYLDNRLLIIDIDVLYIIVSNYSPWIARNVEDYNYKDADWMLINSSYNKEGKLLDNNDMFWKTIQYNQPFFNRKVISTLFD